MFTTPPVNNLGRHLELMAVFISVSDEGPKVIDKLCGGVVSHMCRTGE
jgi:hypothetical protein